MNVNDLKAIAARAQRALEPAERALWAPLAKGLAPLRRPTLFVTAHRTSFVTTGTDRLARAILPRLARAADALGFATCVSLTDDEHELADTLRAARADVVTLPPCDGPLPFPAHVAHFLEREVSRHPSVQFTFRNISSPVHSPSLSIVSLLDVIPLEYGAPYVAPAAQAAHRRKVRAVLAHAAAIVALSESSLAVARRELGLALDNAFLAPPFSTTSAPANRRRTLADLVSGEAARGFLLVHGGSEPRKNVVTVVRAHRALPQEMRARHPLLVLGGAWGGLPLSSVGLDGGIDVDRQGNTRADDHVRHLSKLDDALYADAFASADIVLCPSTHEGFGLPVLDAMQAGVPVIASDIPSHREVVGPDTAGEHVGEHGGAHVSDHGALVPAHDHAAWASAMRRMLDDPALAARTVAHGRVRAATFTPDRMAEGYERALELVRRRFKRAR